MLKKIVLLVMLALPIGVFAQSLKFGHLSSQEVVMAMPEVTEAQTKLQNLRQTYMTEIQKINDEFQRKYQEFQQAMAKDSLPPNIAERRQKELEDMLRKGEQFQQEADQNMAKSQEELMTPIYQKLDDAIKAVGEAEGMIYVFDIARTAIPYINTNQSIDVTQKVKTKLGIK